MMLLQFALLAVFTPIARSDFTQISVLIFIHFHPDAEPRINFQLIFTLTQIGELIFN